jgi:hypothetical protein
MKKVLPLLLSLLVVCTAFAAPQQSNIKGALNQLEETSRSFLVFTTIALLGVGALLAGIGAAIYFMKLKGVQKKETLWVVLAFLSGGLGLLSLLGGVLGLVMYLFMPTLIQGLVGTPPG